MQFEYIALSYSFFSNSTSGKCPVPVYPTLLQSATQGGPQRPDDLKVQQVDNIEIYAGSKLTAYSNNGCHLTDSGAVDWHTLYLHDGNVLFF